MNSIGVAIKKKGVPDLKHRIKICGIFRNNTQQTEKPIEQEIHLNIWKPKTHIFTLREIFVWDFGLRFPTNCDSIYFYFPFKLEKYRTRQNKKRKNWTDLGEIMAQNNDLICTIFNEELQTTKIPNTCFYKISSFTSIDEKANNSFEKSFYLYTLGETNIEFEEIEDGTLMKIKIYDVNKLHEFDEQNPINTIYNSSLKFRIKNLCCKTYSYRWFSVK